VVRSGLTHPPVIAGVVVLPSSDQAEDQREKSSGLWENETLSKSNLLLLLLLSSISIMPFCLRKIDRKIPGSEIVWVPGVDFAVCERVPLLDRRPRPRTSGQNNKN